MNFYKHYIGDYQRDTGHLSLTEHGAYRLMLDIFYATARPLPKDKKTLYRLLRAASRSEREAIDSVTEQFWRAEEDGLVNHRATLEIEKAEKQAQTNRQIARVREERRRLKRSEIREASSYGHTERNADEIDDVTDSLHELDKVFGVCKVNNTQLVSAMQPLSFTNRATNGSTNETREPYREEGFSREPNHSQNQNQKQNQNERVCGNPATNGPQPACSGEKAAFSGRGTGPEKTFSVRDDTHDDEAKRGGEMTGFVEAGTPVTAEDEKEFSGETVSPAELAKVMRAEGVMAQAGDPRVMALSRQGVGVETVTAACAEAKRARPGERIATAYVVKIVERWARDARFIEARGARAHGRSCACLKRRQVLDELTGSNGHTVEGVIRPIEEDGGLPFLPGLPEGDGLAE